METEPPYGSPLETDSLIGNTSDPKAKKNADEAGTQTAQAIRPEQENSPTHSHDSDNHEQLVKKINAMVAIDTGSTDPHHAIDRATLARLPSASTQELNKLVGIIAAVDGFPLIGQVEDINPSNLGQMHADPRVEGEGADKAYAIAQERKEKAAEQFTHQLHKDKQNQG